MNFANYFKKYLRGKKEENILSAIEDSIHAAALEFDSSLAKNVSLDWRIRKDQICQMFGLVKEESTEPTTVRQIMAAPSWNKNSLGRAVLGPISGSGEFNDVELVQPTSGQVVAPTISAQTYQGGMQSYTEIVQELNYARQSKSTYPLSQRFHEVSQTIGSDIRANQMQDVWKIITEITGEDAGERKYSQAYLKAANNSQEAIDLRRRIVEGGKRYLERQFYERIEADIAQQPMSALMGGVPSVLNKIRAVLQMRYSENGEWVHGSLEIINNSPIWALIYYMVRSGCLKEALEFTASSRDAFQKLGTSFPIYLKAFVESPHRVLPGNLLENIRKEFNEQVRFFDEESSDPFKFALYKIIGRCEVDKKSFPGVINTTEDWLWSHLSLIYEDAGSNSVNEKYTLQNLQMTVTNFGAKYFNPDRKTPALYCQVLIMCGLFEKAVHYAYAFSQIDAVHFGIALSYYGLLRPITNVLQLQSELLYMNKYEQSELNFARLMGFYTRDFRRSDPVDAVEYLVLICLNKDLKDGKEHLKICHEALKELVLETREFSKLLGDIKQDGSRNPGAIEQKMGLIELNDIDSYLRDITQQAAIKAEEDGRIADAVLLYQLSEDCDTVITIINKSLGEMLSVTPLGQGITAMSGGLSLVISPKDDPAQLAQHVMEVYSNNLRLLEKVKPNNLETCETLLKIVNARDSFVRGDVEQCLRDVDDTKILMLDPEADVGMVRSRAQQSQALQQPVARNVASLLVMVMRCCSEVVEQLNNSYYEVEGRQEVRELRNSYVY